MGMGRNLHRRHALILALALCTSSAFSQVQYTELFTEGADKAEVASCIQKGKNNLSHKNLCRILEDSEHYRAYIRKRIKEMNLPPCLEYLPIIESGYKPTAKPANGTSMGIWQFMPNSVHPYMELSDYVDERRDPWLSTDGALKKLKENYKQFKDWPLALAAYNCGAGAVSRALK
ncbi:MAG: lytic transglycosylase domain-containing protein, partial [Treponema sp.]|nr:lytic transglycosylase domain-containing protein [Treponema sp.]